MGQLARHLKSIVNISEDSLSEIEASVYPKEFAKKRLLLGHKDIVKEVYFIKSGCTRTYVTDYNGVEHNISFAMENWWFGDLQGFINNTTASFEIQALEDTAALCMNRENWDRLLIEVPEFVAYTRVLFRNTMFAHENRILQRLSLNAEERYEQFLKNYPDLPHRISQKHIASYLGITPEFLSMIRKNR